MEEILTYSQVKGYDPTRTTALRNAFAKNMRKRFNELTTVVKKSVDDNDCFGLKEKGITVLQLNPTPRRAFDFARSNEKIEAFMIWLQKQVDAGLVQTGTAKQIGRAVEGAWMNIYILDSYKRGVMRARYELQKAGMKVPSVEDNGGINMVMNTPFHIDRVGLLYTRIFTELKGITDAMDQQISRVLSQGIIDGDGPALLAKKLVAAIDGTNAGKLGMTDTLGRYIPAERRADILARTEIIRAHHVATIQEYRNWGVEGITVLGEWTTAGDGRVCEDCASLEGKIFSLDEIEGMIPYHPECRCIALPYVEGIEKYE
jgi:SPP1 gp7 family putative phage head morphogenesis protein